jgi:uncharacterized phage protein (TIGR01671 family)
MKRVLKFRGKRIDNGQWVEGMLDYRITSGLFVIHVTADLPPTQFEPGGDIYSEYFEVDPETVGQFTGLLDKNGTEIYENDLIKTEAGIYKVFFGDNKEDHFIGWSVEKVTNKEHFSINGIEGKNNNIEVIGNVFENANLLQP